MSTISQSNAPSRTNVAGLLEEVRRRENELIAYLPEGVSAERFMQLARKAITEQPALAECSSSSVLRALRNCAVSGLPLDQHYSSIVIRRSKQGSPQACWDASAHGMTWLALESGFVRAVDCQVVREHDEFRVELGSVAMIHHVPLLMGERGEVICVYATALLNTGAKLIEVMTREDLSRIKAASSAGDRGPWSEQQWFDEMARKSVTRRLLKRLPAGSTRRAGCLPDGLPEEPADQNVGGNNRTLLPEDQHAMECQALAQLSDVRNIGELDAAWTAAQLTFSRRGAEVPLAVEARWRELRETIAEVS